MGKLCLNFKLPLTTPVILAAFLFGCAHKIIVEIPPKIDLQSHQTIGLVEFSSNSTDQLNQFATQKFMAVIQQAQPQVRFLELGPQEQLLKSLGREKLDHEAIKALGKKFGVKTVFTGTYEISEVRPRLRFGEDFTSINASAIVNISMVSKHWEADTGATLWTSSRRGEWPLASIKKESGRAISLGMNVPEDKYEHSIEQLVYAVTDDFRPHYEERKIPKN